MTGLCIFGKDQPDRVPLRLATIAVQLHLLADALYIPPEYQITGAHYNAHMRVIDLFVQSPELPELKDDCMIPQITLVHHWEYIPGLPDFRKITGEIVKHL